MTPEDYLSIPENLAKHTKGFRLDFDGIAAELGCHPNTVRNHTKEAQEALRQQREADILAALNKGQSIAGAARALGVDRSVVKGVAEKRGLIKHRPSAETRRQEAVRLSEKGLSFAKVAEKLGVSAATAYRDVAVYKIEEGLPPEPEFDAESVSMVLTMLAAGEAAGETAAETAAKFEKHTPFKSRDVLRILGTHPSNYAATRHYIATSKAMDWNDAGTWWPVFAETVEEVEWAKALEFSRVPKMKLKRGQYGRRLSEVDTRKLDRQVRSWKRAR